MVDCDIWHVPLSIPPAQVTFSPEHLWKAIWLLGDGGSHYSEPQDVKSWREFLLRLSLNPLELKLKTIKFLKISFINTQCVKIEKNIYSLGKYLTSLNLYFLENILLGMLGLEARLSRMLGKHTIFKPHTFLADFRLVYMLVWMHHKLLFCDANASATAALSLL